MQKLVSSYELGAWGAFLFLAFVWNSWAIMGSVHSLYSVCAGEFRSWVLLI